MLEWCVFSFHESSAAIAKITKKFNCILMPFFVLFFIKKFNNFGRPILTYFRAQTRLWCKTNKMKEIRLTDYSNEYNEANSF